MSWESSVESFLTHIEQLKDYFLKADVRKDSVSAWSIGQHTEHLLLVAESISTLLAKEEFGSDTGSINFTGRICFFLGKFPRGKAQAPERVQPKNVSPDTFFLRSGQVYGFYANLEKLPPGKLKHPAFGVLNAAEWLRFLELHQRHHLAIMHDIMLGG